MKRQLKFAKILTATTVVSLIGGLAFWGQNVQGQISDPTHIEKVEPSLQHTPKIENEVVEGVELQAKLSTASKEDYEPLDPIVVSLTLKNVSNKIVGFTENFSPQDYLIIVKNSAGVFMPFTRYGYSNEPGKGAISSASRKVNLNPGEVKTFQVTINRIIDMTVDDDYSIVIRRSVSVGKEFGDAQSNELHVDVTTTSSNGGDISLPGGEPSGNPLE